MGNWPPQSDFVLAQKLIITAQKFVVVSAFRNSSSHQINTWLQQVQALSFYAPIRAIAVVGDDTSATDMKLRAAAHRIGIGSIVSVHQFSHGGPHFGSVESKERMAQLSLVGNAMLDAASPAEDEFVFYVESDLLWSPDVPIRLSWELNGNPHVGSISPMVWTRAGAFYDIWAFRLDGTRFSPFFPHFVGQHKDDTVVHVDSAGSCLLIRSQVAKEARMKDNALVSWCAEVKKKGWSIAVALKVPVYHP